MDSINRRFSVATGYDLQHTLFTNNLRAFHNKGLGRTTRVESIRARQMNQPIHVPKMETMPMHAPENENVMEEAPNDLSMQNAKVNMENQPQPIPLTIRLADNAQLDLEDLIEKATRNMDALLHPQLQQNLHDPFI